MLEMTKKLRRLAIAELFVIEELLDSVTLRVGGSFDEGVFQDIVGVIVDAGDDKVADFGRDVGWKRSNHMMVFCYLT